MTKSLQWIAKKIEFGFIKLYTDIQKLTNIQWFLLK